MGVIFFIVNFLENLYFGYLDEAIFKSFQSSAEDEKIREPIKKYLELIEQYPASHLENLGMVPGELMEKLKKIKFFGLNIPEAYGGVGLNLLQYLKVVEKISSDNMDLGITALAHQSIDAKGIVLFGNEDQKKKYLVPAASGEMIFSYALTEPQKGSDAKNIETTAVLSEDGKHYILNGQKSYITNANYAGGLTVFAQMDSKHPGFMGAFIVETSWDGVKIGKEIPKMGLKASSTAGIKFKNVRVPKENLLGQPGDGFKIAMSILNYGRLALGAASAGIMKQSLQDMLKRSQSRIQFGMPIFHFELVQEKMVKAAVNSRVTDVITAFTAGMLSDDPLAQVAIESSHCKLFGTTRAWDTLYDALQLAGGSGYFSTHPYEKRMRDFRVTTIFEGTTEIHSIYPALYFMRDLRKHMLATTHTRIGQIAFLIKGLFKRTHWIRFNLKDMRHATSVAKSLLRRIRLMVLVGLLLYRQDVLEKEFFLRRITTFSLYLYGIIAMLADIEAARRAGKSVSANLKLLDYFVTEACSVKKRHQHVLPSRKEYLNREVFKMIREDQLM